MKTIDLSTLERFRAPKIQDYIAVVGKVTRVMNLRIVKKTESSKRQYTTTFQCGVDILPLANGGHIIITTLGFYAFTFVEFVQSFLEYQRRELEKYRKYQRDYNPLDGFGFIFTDDTDALSTWDDDDGNIIENNVESEYVEDEKLLEDIKCYDSTDLFIEALTQSHE